HRMDRARSSAGRKANRTKTARTASRRRIGRARRPVAPTKILSEIVRFAPEEFVVGKRSDLARLNQNDIVRILHIAFDQEKIFFRNQKTEPLEQIRIDN